MSFSGDSVALQLRDQQSTADDRRSVRFKVNSKVELIWRRNTVVVSLF